MIIHPTTSVLFVVEDTDSSIQAFISYLESVPHIQQTVAPKPPHDLSTFDVVVTANTSDFKFSTVYCDDWAVDR